MTRKSVTAAIDCGFGAVKAAIAGGDILYFPSGASPIGNVLHSMSGDRLTNRQPILIDGEEWVAGFEPTEARYDRHMASQFAMSPDYRALIIESLSQLNTDSIDVLVLSLPSHEFDGASKDHLKKSFKGKLEVKGETVNVKHVLVADQPLGTAAIYFDKNKERLQYGRIMVLDIGYGTTDVAVIQDGGVDRNRSLSLQIAMRTVCERTASEFGRSYRAEAIDHLLRTNKGYESNGRKLSDVIAPHADTVAREITNSVRGRLGAFEEFSEILVTGGGAKILGGPIKALVKDTKIAVMDDPVTANLRGFLAMAASYGNG